MAKRVRLSSDAGATYYTLPGNSAELNNEAGSIDDTIFGYDFQSMQPSLVGATITANGLYKGFAGYVAVISKPGTPTAMTAEAMALVSGKTYQISDSTKRVWDRSDITILDNAVPVSDANIESIDFLFGRVTFISSYSPTTPITVTGDYIPMAQIARGTGFTLGQTANMVDDTDFETAQGNSGHRKFIYGLKTVELELTGIFATSNAFRALLDSRAETIIEINPDGNSKSVARGFFRPLSTGQSGDVGDQEVETISFGLNVPDQVPAVETPFKWVHANDTTLSQAIIEALTAWEGSTTILGQYLYDGTNGVVSDVLIQDVSLTGGLEVMNEFSIGLQVSDEFSAVP